MSKKVVPTMKTKRTIKAVKAKKEYVVSWKPISNNCVYGRNEKNSNSTFCDPMTILQARGKAKELWGGKVGIYKLVLVEERKGR